MAKSSRSTTGVLFPPNGTLDSAPARARRSHSSRLDGAVTLDRAGAMGRTIGSYPQKAVVVENADGRAAFLGGVDLALGRWDSASTGPTSRAQRTAAAPRGRALARPARRPLPHHRAGGRRHRDHLPAALERPPARQSGGETIVPGRSTPLEPLLDASHLVQVNGPSRPGCRPGRSSRSASPSGALAAQAQRDPTRQAPHAHRGPVPRDARPGRLRRAVRAPDPSRRPTPTPDVTSA
jgi:hypothetical protein